MVAAGFFSFASFQRKKACFFPSAPPCRSLVFSFFFEKMLRLPFLFPVKTSLPLKKYPLPIFCFYLPSLPMLFLFFIKKNSFFSNIRHSEQEKGKFCTTLPRVTPSLAKKIHDSFLFFFQQIMPRDGIACGEDHWTSVRRGISGVERRNR